MPRVTWKEAAALMEGWPTKWSRAGTEDKSGVTDAGGSGESSQLRAVLPNVWVGCGPGLDHWACGGQASGDLAKDGFGGEAPQGH